MTLLTLVHVAANPLRLRLSLAFALGLLADFGCHKDAPAPAAPAAAPATLGPAAAPSGSAGPDPDAQPPGLDLPPARRAIQVVNGQERTVDVELSVSRGLTTVDLTDEWAPSIFADGVGPNQVVLPNRYRAVYVGLANDRTDGDGQELPRGARNYLELYGIPPSLSVLRARFVADAERTCEQSVDTAKLLAVEGIETWGATTEKKELQSRKLLALRLEAARQKAAVGSLEDLAGADARYARDLKTLRRFEAERAAFAEVEKRLACEGLMDPAKHQPGLYDTPMRLAMLDFQQKNGLMDQADVTRPTLEALARPIQLGNFAALRRVIEDRAAHAGQFIEDGSASLPARGGKPRRPPTYKTASGERAEVPDLVAAATDAVMARLGADTPEGALAFFRRHPAADFHWLKVVARFPPLPEYYSEHMDLFAEIDRGDIWYDFPFNNKGVRLPQPRDRYPSFTMYVKWRGERVALVRWRTTIGGWRLELAADGAEYYRYKDSDVGPRVWRHIVAAPVWIPPPSSPLSGMVKTKWVNGAPTRVTNYDETGPGYLSAYGLAAAIHVDMRKHAGGPTTYFDNGIRTHGSFDYMSLRGRFSHGCHRLQNNLAVRLYSFVLAHRHARTLGPAALDFRRTFWHTGEIFDMRLPTRGFYYELDPPLPVETLEGQIKGTVQKAIAGYVRKPGVTYSTAAPPTATAGPESKAGGGAEAPSP